MSMTYASLKEDLRRYLERGNAADSEVFAQVPNIIELAQRDIATKLKLLGFLTNAISTMTTGSPVLDKPDRWRETASFNFGVGASPLERRTLLLPRSYEYCNAYWPNRELLDEPRFYADYDYGHWLVVPTPNANYPFEVNYWQLPPLLSDANQTNWTTDYAPNALLNGALWQTELFLKNEERAGVWKPVYDEAMQALDGQDLQRILDRTTVRTEV